MALTFGASEDTSELPGPEGLKVGSLSPGADSEDKPTPKRRGRPPGSKNRTSVSLEKLEENLKDKLLEELVVPIAFVSPLAAANVEARAERTAKAAARLAAKNPKVRKGIEKMLEGSDVFTLVMFPLSTAICAMVDFDMLPALSPPARAVSVPRLHEEVYGEPPRREESSTMNGSHSGAARGLYAELNDDDVHM